MSTGIGSAAVGSGRGPSAAGPSADALITAAMQYIGGKYVYGGTNIQTGVDCSGFTQYLFNQLGINIGRDTSAQRAAGTLQDVQGGLANAKPGDLLFFGDTAGPNAHVGIYLGNGKMISAENPTDGIAVADISSGAFGGEQLNQIRSAPSIAPATRTYSPIVTSAGTSIGGNPPAGSGASADTPFDPNGSYEVGPALDAWVKQNAGQRAWMLTNPELSKILGYVAQYNITDPNEVTSLVAQTDWYKTHSAAQQAWTQKYGSNIAQAQKDITDAHAEIVKQAQQMGAQLTADQLNTLAINTNYYGWTPTELTNAIAGYLPTAQGNNPIQGQAGVDFNTLKALATQTWGVPTSDQQLQTWVTQIAEGQQTTDQIQSLLKSQAQSLYPTLSDQFTRGFTFATATDPYKQLIQRYLGTPQDQVNFTDPKWLPLLNQVDPKTGSRTEMGLDAAATYLRSTPSLGYQNTAMGQNEQVGLANAAAKTLGAIA